VADLISKGGADDHAPSCRVPLLPRYGLSEILAVVLKVSAAAFAATNGGEGAGFGPSATRSSWMGWRFTAELERGQELLARIRGRCDLVLHGHRHVPYERQPFADARPVRVFNAGSSTELGRACIFTHMAGELLTEPTWLDALGVVRDDVWPELTDAAAIAVGGDRRSAL
jgi:hypothetical protein